MIWSHVRNGALAAVVLTVTLPAAAAAAPFNYTFDADAQGWVAVAVGPRSDAVLQSDGRQPWRIHRGGSTSSTPAPERALLHACLVSVVPSPSMSPTMVGRSRSTRRWSARIRQSMMPRFPPSASVALCQWAPIRFHLAAEWSADVRLWHIVVHARHGRELVLQSADGPSSPRTATEADFLAYLPLVTHFSVFTSFKIDRGTNGAISVGFDNISLTAPTPAPTPVPEPATLTLLGAGLASVVARRYRRR